MKPEVFKKFLDQEIIFLNKLWDKILKYNIQDSQEVLDFLDKLNEISIRR